MPICIIMMNTIGIAMKVTRVRNRMLTSMSTNRSHTYMAIFPIYIIVIGTEAAR